MADVTQYKFDLSEVAEVLIRKVGITEGLWALGVNFNIGVTTAGPDKDHIRPSALVSVDQLILTRASAMGPLVFDAAAMAGKSR